MINQSQTCLELETHLYPFEIVSNHMSTLANNCGKVVTSIWKCTLVDNWLNYQMLANE
jgi:hypothetical protein